MRGGGLAVLMQNRPAFGGGADGDVIEQIKINVAAGAAMKAKDRPTAAIITGGREAEVGLRPTLEHPGRERIIGSDETHESGRAKTAICDFLGDNMPESNALKGPGKLTDFLMVASSGALAEIDHSG